MNKKGFVLAEAIVTSVFVLGLFVYMVINIFPLVISNEKTISYNGLEEVYLITTLKDELVLREFNFDNGVYNVVKDVDGVDFKRITSTGYYSYSNSYKSLSNILYYHLIVSEIYIFEPSTNINPSNVNRYKKYLSRSMREYSNYYYIQNIKERKNLPGKVMLVRFQNKTFGNIVI